MNNQIHIQQLEQNFAINREDSRIVIVGLGATGMSAANYLHRLGFRFAVIDSRDRPPLVAELNQQLPDVALFTGGFDQAAMDVATHLIVSPGVAINEKAVQQCVQRGARIVSDIDIFAAVNDKPVIGITGSNGKSTVTTLLGLMAEEQGIHVAIGGNLGTPALDLLDQNADLYVLEISSFQLERTHLLEATAATVLNVTADHLDRHENMQAYAAEKQRVFSGHGVMVLNADDPIVMQMQEAGRESIHFSVCGQPADYWLDSEHSMLKYKQQDIIAVAEVPLQGLHNLANVLATMALAGVVGISQQSMCKALKNFRGLDHRMQKVAEISGVMWINDSKSTNVGACVAALQGYTQNVILIAGGDAKGAQMSELRPAVEQACKAVIVMGKDAGKIQQALQQCVPMYAAKNIKHAVELAAEKADVGDIVLLSPACASLDQFKNYVERGNRFTEAVLGLNK